MKVVKSSIFKVVLFMVMIVMISIIYISTEPKAPIVTRNVIHIEAGDGCEVIKEDLLAILSNDGVNIVSSNINCQLGEYQVRVEVDGFLRSKVFNYEVVVSDTLPPSIKYEGETYIEEFINSRSGLNRCSERDDKYFIDVSDSNSDDITVTKEGTIKPCEPGIQVITYYANDGFDNISELVITYDFKDSEERYISSDYILINTSVLNVRESYGIDSKVLDKVKQGEKYDIIEQVRDEYNRLWIKIDTGTIKGWIAGWYVLDPTQNLDELIDIASLKVGQYIDGHRVKEITYDMLERTRIVIEVNDWIEASEYNFGTHAVPHVEIKENLFDKNLYFRYSSTEGIEMTLKVFRVEFEQWKSASKIWEASEEDIIEFYIGDCHITEPHDYSVGLSCYIIDSRIKE